GLILDQAVRRVNAKRILELGTYCGYSSLRMAVAAPAAHIVSVEFSAANAEIARRIHAHAGAAGRGTVGVGELGDGGAAARGWGGCARSTDCATGVSTSCSSTTQKTLTCQTWNASSKAIGCALVEWRSPTT